MKTARRFVKIYPETRKDKPPVYRVVWTPAPRDRRRVAFTDAAAAEKKADEVEEQMRLGISELSKTPRQELIAFNMLRQQIPPEVPLHEVARFWLAAHPTAIAKTKPVNEVCALFLPTRDSKSERHTSTIKYHIGRFAEHFGVTPITNIHHDDIQLYLDEQIGGTGKTRAGHLRTLRSMFRWARDKGVKGQPPFLPTGLPTATDLVDMPEVQHAEKVAFSPEEMIRLLAASPEETLTWYVIGAFGGIREAERGRLLWRHWREDEDNKIVCNRDITKTKHRRRVDVPPNLVDWLRLMRGEPDERMEGCADPLKWSCRGPRPTSSKPRTRRGGVKWKNNGLRVSFASYHLALHDNANLTASIDGHTVDELLTTYQSIEGVTKAKAEEWFAITPSSVVEFAEKNGLPKPVWTERMK